jgi:glutathione S-transferase
MSLTLYAHPFAAYCWKVLIALYENGTPFRLRMVDNAAVFAELEALWPLKKIPVLKDGAASVIESSVIIEHLMLRYPGPTRLIPEAIDAVLKVRFMDRFFDNYVMTPFQKLVLDRMRADGEHDAKGVAEARAMLDSAYGWLEKQVAPQAWAVGSHFTMGDCPLLPRFSMRIGCIQSATDSQSLGPTALDYLLGRRSPAQLMRRDPTASYSLWAPQIATSKRFELTWPSSSTLQCSNVDGTH